ncbi:MAG: TlpA family protein disulfide reductase [Myxococcales bacterium]|nr:TlpA family protein disulfide reductase [Myxococcales bacterium]
MAQPEFYSGKSLYPAIGVLLALSLLFGLAVMPRLSFDGPLVGKPAPDFELPIVANGEVGARLRLSQLAGKIVILDFWATWCGPCAHQAPILDRIARKHPNEVVVLGINVGEHAPVAARYAAQKGLSYFILSDEEGAAQALYDASSLPTIAIVDQTGIVKSYARGLTREASLERQLAALLAPSPK